MTARSRWIACALLVQVALPSLGRAAVPALDPVMEAELRTAYRRLVDAENAHDLATVRELFLDSPTTLLVAKTRTAEEGDWAGFWGYETVVSHIGDLFSGVFVILPDYARERVALLGSDVAQTYVPLQIAVGYAGQSGTPKPFLMIIDWVRVGHGWKIASDIAIPVPASQPAQAETRRES